MTSIWGSEEYTGHSSSLTLGGGGFLGSSCSRLLPSHNPAGDLLNSSLQCVSQIPVPPPPFPPPRFRASICPRENCKVSLLQGVPSFPLQDALTLLKSALRLPPAAVHYPGLQGACHRASAYFQGFTAPCARCPGLLAVLQCPGAASYPLLCLGCLLSFVCHCPPTFFSPDFSHLSSIKSHLRRHFLKPRLACSSWDFCTSIPVLTSSD